MILRTGHLVQIKLIFNPKRQILKNAGNNNENVLLKQLVYIS
jgi:hypothetical protein